MYLSTFVLLQHCYIYNQFLQIDSNIDPILLNCFEVNQYLTIGKFKITDTLVNDLIEMALTEEVYKIIKLHQDEDEVYQIQKDLHHHIIDFCYNNLVTTKFHSDKILIIELIKRVSEKLPFNILNFLRFRIAFIKYSKELIILLRELIRRSEPDIQEPISSHYLLKHFEEKMIYLPFKYTFLRSTFLPYLKDRFPIRFGYIKDYS